MWTIMALDQWKNWLMRAKRSLPWGKGGTGVSFPLEIAAAEEAIQIFSGK